MTSKLVVNTIEADTGISSVSFASSISLSSTSVFHLGDAGVNIGADTNISRAGNGILAFNINGSEKARIASDGKVKIGGGTASLALLHIAPADYSLNLQNNSSNKSKILFTKNGTPNDARSWIEGNGELNGYLAFAAGDNERLRITSGGNVEISDGNLIVANGHGIDFSATSDASGMSSELFDAYEEGVWTPSLTKSGGSGNANSQVSSRAGRYVRIGKTVFLSFYWYGPSVTFSGGNEWIIEGLPFSIRNGNPYNFLSGGYLLINGSVPSNNGSGYRWQANTTSTLNLYHAASNTNATGSHLEFSGSGILELLS